MAAQSEPPSSLRVIAHEHDQVARLLEVHRDAAADVGHLADGADQERGGIARLLPSWVYSLLRLSLPEMNGVL